MITYDVEVILLPLWTVLAFFNCFALSLTKSFVLKMIGKWKTCFDYTCTDLLIGLDATWFLKGCFYLFSSLKTWFSLPLGELYFLYIYSCLLLVKEIIDTYFPFPLYIYYIGFFLKLVADAFYLSTLFNLILFVAFLSGRVGSLVLSYLIYPLDIASISLCRLNDYCSL